MSAPYIYSPSTFEPTPYFGYGTYKQVTPFIPPSQLPGPSAPFPTAYPPSPYSRPGTPRGTPRVHFEDTYWMPPLAPRTRRPSWHGEVPPPSPFLSIPSTSTHVRRSSFGGAYRSWETPWTSSSPQFEIHPFLNGEAPVPDFYFDLAAPSFSPLMRVGYTQSAIVSTEDLGLPAMMPHVTRMRITHDAIPQWPIDLAYDSDGYNASPPITLGDVLYAIHASLRQQIRQTDWVRLSTSAQTDIARAYTQRCGSVPSSAQVEASQGVKRIDYLRNKHTFRGLIRRRDEDGLYHWKLITA